jgi:hypothetical protein
LRVLLLAVSVCVFSGYLASCALNPRGDLPSADNDDGEFVSAPEPDGFGEATTPGDDTAVFPEPEGLPTPNAPEGFTEDDNAGTAAEEPAPFEPEPPVMGAGGSGSGPEPGAAGGSAGIGESGGAAGTDVMPTDRDGGAGAADGGAGAPDGSAGATDSGAPIDSGSPPHPDGGTSGP